MRCSKLSNVHTVQEAAEMFASASTQTPGPLNSCVSCLSSAPLHITADVHVPRTHSDAHFSHNISAFSSSNPMVCDFFPKEKKAYKTVKQNGPPLLAEVQEHHQKTFLSVTAPKYTHTHPCNQIHTYTHTSATCVCVLDGCQRQKACSDRTKAPQAL